MEGHSNRCYFWDNLNDAEAYQTMYKWEKVKYLPKLQRAQEEEVRYLEEFN